MLCFHGGRREKGSREASRRDLAGADKEERGGGGRAAGDTGWVLAIQEACSKQTSSGQPSGQVGGGEAWRPSIQHIGGMGAPGGGRLQSRARGSRSAEVEVVGRQISRPLVDATEHLE